MIQAHLNQLVFPIQPIHLFVTENIGSQNSKLRKVKNFRIGWIKSQPHFPIAVQTLPSPRAGSVFRSGSFIAAKWPQIPYHPETVRPYVLETIKQQSSASPLRTSSNHVTTSELILVTKKIICIGWLNPTSVIFDLASSPRVVKCR